MVSIRYALGFAGALGKSSDSLKLKMLRLGLKVVVPQIHDTTTSNLELMSVEDALKKLQQALNSLENPELDQVQVLRLRSQVQGAKIYIDKFSEYLNYRELEVRLVELEGKYAALVKKPSKLQPT